jgi:5-methylcytosine-specific restriction endonuclease McrA
VFVYVGSPPKTGRPARDEDPLVKECRRHGLAPHGRYSGGGGTTRVRCKRCVAEAVTRRHRKVRALLVAEAGGRCAVCGYDRCLLNLQFHHVDPAAKALEMTAASGRSLAAYRAEAMKCVLVCANCHGEIEAGLIPSPPAGARFG